MSDTEIKKEIFEHLVKAHKAKIIVANEGKELLHRIKEDICSEWGWRKKGANQGVLDIAKVPSKVLLASINKFYKLKKKNAYEAEIDLYELINDGIEKENLDIGLMNTYANKFEQEQEAKKEIAASKKYLQSKVESNDIEPEDASLMEEAVKLYMETVKAEETEKLNKKIGKPTKTKNLSNRESTDLEALRELIEELGLEDKIKIEE